MDSTPPADAPDPGADGLSPDTLQTLEQAINAIAEQVADDPKYSDLVGSLKGVQDALDSIEGPDAEDAEPKDDEYSFDDAEKKFTAARKAAKEGQ